MSPAVGPYSSFSHRKSSTSTSSTAGVASPRSARFSSTLSSSIRWPRLYVSVRASTCDLRSASARASTASAFATPSSPSASRSSTVRWATRSSANDSRREALLGHQRDQHGGQQPGGEHDPGQRLAAGGGARLDRDQPRAAAGVERSRDAARGQRRRREDLVAAVGDAHVQVVGAAQRLADQLRGLHGADGDAGQRVGAIGGRGQRRAALERGLDQQHGPLRRSGGRDAAAAVGDRGLDGVGDGRVGRHVEADRARVPGRRGDEGGGVVGRALAGGADAARSRLGDREPVLRSKVERIGAVTRGAHETASSAGFCSAGWANCAKSSIVRAVENTPTMPRTSARVAASCARIEPTARSAVRARSAAASWSVLRLTAANAATASSTSTPKTISVRVWGRRLAAAGSGPRSFSSGSAGSSSPSTSPVSAVRARSLNRRAHHMTLQRVGFTKTNEQRVPMSQM